MLVAGAVLALYRMVVGPRVLDRVLAADILIAIFASGVAIEAAWNHNRTSTPILLVLSLLAFTATVGVARFVVREKPTERSYRDFIAAAQEVQDD